MAGLPQALQVLLKAAENLQSDAVTKIVDALKYSGKDYAALRTSILGHLSGLSGDAQKQFADDFINLVYTYFSRGNNIVKIYRNSKPEARKLILRFCYTFRINIDGIEQTAEVLAYTKPDSVVSADGSVVWGNEKLSNIVIALLDVAFKLSEKKPLGFLRPLNVESVKDKLDLDNLPGYLQKSGFAGILPNDPAKRNDDILASLAYLTFIGAWESGIYDKTSTETKCNVDSAALTKQQTYVKAAFLSNTVNATMKDTFWQKIQKQLPSGFHNTIGAIPQLAELMDWELWE